MRTIDNPGELRTIEETEDTPIFQQMIEEGWPADGAVADQDDDKVEPSDNSGEDGEDAPQEPEAVPLPDTEVDDGEDDEDGGQ